MVSGVAIAPTMPIRHWANGAVFSRTPSEKSMRPVDTSATMCMADMKGGQSAMSRQLRESAVGMRIVRSLAKPARVACYRYVFDRRM